MNYTISPFNKCWAVGKTCTSGLTTHLAYFPEEEEARAMLEALTFDIHPPATTDTYVVHSNVGPAELHWKFDGPDIRITIEHDGDSEVTLTRQEFKRMLSSLQAMD